MKKYAAFAVLLFLASACAQLGLVSPRSMEDRLVYTHLAIQQVAGVTLSLVQQKQIKKETAMRVHKALEASLALVDQAATLHYSGKAKEAADKLRDADKTFEGAKKELKGGNGART